MTYTEEMLRGKVAAAMKARRVTQVQLAAVLGVRQQHVSARLRGTVRFTVGDIVNMAEFFGITPNDLLNDRPLVIRGRKK